MFCPPLKQYQFEPPSSVTKQNMSFFPLTFVSVGGDPFGQSNVNGHVIETEVDVYVKMIVRLLTIPLAGMLFMYMFDMLSVRETVNMFAVFRSNVSDPLEEETSAFSSSENVPTPAAFMSAMVPLLLVYIFRVYTIVNVPIELMTFQSVFAVTHTSSTDALAPALVTWIYPARPVVVAS